MRKIPWTNEEIQILINEYQNKTNKEICELLPNRSKTSINGYARKRLKLKRTEEVKRKSRSDRMIGEKNPMFGKQSINKGKKLSIETKNKISISKKGREGLAGEKNPMFGRKPYNKGKKLEELFDEEKIQTIKEKLRKTKEKHWNNLSKEQKELITNNRRKAIIDRIQKMNKEPTIPEKIVNEILVETKVSFVYQQKIDFYLVDFFLPDHNLIIEVQGDYWHGNPRSFPNLNQIQKINQRRDKAKKTFFENKNFRILYLWEYDLKNHIIETKNKIYETIFYYFT